MFFRSLKNEDRSMDRLRISTKNFFLDSPQLNCCLGESYKIIHTMLSALASITKGQPEKEDACKSAEKKAELDFLKVINLKNSNMALFLQYLLRVSFISSSMPIFISSIHSTKYSAWHIENIKKQLPLN